MATKSLNAYLDIILAKVYEARRTLIETGKPITAVAIRDIVSGAAERNRMLFKIYQAHNDTVKALIGLECSEDLLEKHERVLKYLKEFVQLKYNLPDINIYAIDHEFGQNLYNWLRTVRKCSHNTAVTYIGFFKKIILSCISNGWLQADPFTKLSITLDEVDPPYSSLKGNCRPSPTKILKTNAFRVSAMFLSSVVSRPWHTLMSNNSKNPKSQ
jgi:hypothetical protein